MNFSYMQETDSKIVFPVLDKTIHPSLWVDSSSATEGASLKKEYLQIPSENNIINRAWQNLNTSNNKEVINEARKLLNEIQNLITIFKYYDFDICALPKLNSFFDEDGSFLIEWIFSNFRIGFNIESKIVDSSWYIVSDSKLGDINAYGLLSSGQNEKLLTWIINFILSNA